MSFLYNLMQQVDNKEKDKTYKSFYYTPLVHASDRACRRPRPDHYVLLLLFRARPNIIWSPITETKTHKPSLAQNPVQSQSRTQQNFVLGYLTLR